MMRKSSVVDYTANFNAIDNASGKYVVYFVMVYVNISENNHYNYKYHYS